MKKSLNHQKRDACYRHKPIRSLAALCLALNVKETVILGIAQRADAMYRVAAVELKPDGTTRQTFDAHPPLKAIQVRIKERILENVLYPYYLTGSLPGCSPQKNAAIHAGATLSIAEDIANFFPSVKRPAVQNVWSGLFKFSPEVADILTRLTTRQDGMPQGAVTSSYLANLIFWEYEPILVGNFEKIGLRYTRLVDDITVSSRHRLSKIVQSLIVRNVYGMLLRKGFKPKRAKHEVCTSRRRMRTTKLVNNVVVTLPHETRASIRSAVFQLECRHKAGECGLPIQRSLASVTGHVGRLGTFHPTEAKALKLRLKTLRDQLVII